ncbi:hypothetical protein V144x_13030 [Gimesia aquarii]|uniref:Uncharacterized protein n=1 Tax=Gimesia aquarii TaxID=2527964 RepID=A0A517VS61_9PLAN|nr:hypothetical protein V144x_13030 [Gimesia aquarii]
MPGELGILIDPFILLAARSLHHYMLEHGALSLSSGSPLDELLR